MNSNESRSRRPPDWLDDYESGQGFSDEEEEANMAGIDNMQTQKPMKLQ